MTDQIEQTEQEQQVQEVQPVDMYKQPVVLVKDVEIVEVEQEDGTVKKEQKLITEEYPYPIFVKGSLVKKAINLGAKFENAETKVDEKIIDDLADFAVALYGNQFTRSELIDGLDASDLLSTLIGIMSSATQGNNQKKAM